MDPSNWYETEWWHWTDYISQRIKTTVALSTCVRWVVTLDWLTQPKNQTTVALTPRMNRVVTLYWPGQPKNQTTVALSLWLCVPGWLVCASRVSMQQLWQLCQTWLKQRQSCKRVTHCMEKWIKRSGEGRALSHLNSCTKIWTKMSTAIHQISAHRENKIQLITNLCISTN